MIYFDNAATSLQKPPAVFSAMRLAMEKAGGYGRSAHRAAMYAGELVYTCRELAVRLFGLEAPEQVVFTLNATHAINQAIHALAGEETFAAVSGYEHNSVIRPLVERGIPFQVLEHAPFDSEGFLQSAEKALHEGANLFVINHMSNVFGGIVPLEALDALLVDANVPMIVDASQTAGAMALDVRKLRSAAAVCMPGHKGLLGPQGTGMLLVCSNKLQKPLIQGGTGSMSSDLYQPDFMPDRFESGTPNVVGIAGLAEGLQYILAQDKRNGVHERELIALLAKHLRMMPEMQIFHSANAMLQGGVLSFRHAYLPCEVIAEHLAEREVCVRAGLHCAPLAHRYAGTLATGTVRVSLGALNTKEEVAAFADLLGEILEKQ